MLHIPARDIPVPGSVSAEARATLERGLPGPAFSDFPPPDDKPAWRAYAAERDAFRASLAKDLLADYPGTIDERQVGECPVYVITPPGIGADDRRVYLDFHGGGWTLFGGDSCRFTGSQMATALGARTWTVDYRLSLDFPFPHPLDDCVTAYRALLAEYSPEQIVVGGLSSGANLAAALMHRAADEGLPLPAALILNTGAFDLTQSGDSLRTNLGLDNVLVADLTRVITLYTAGHDLRDPYLSPLFGDLSRFPPSVILTGTRDLLLSDNVRMHRALRAAGVHADLHVFEAAGHGNFFGLAPEDADRNGEMRRFAEAHWA